MRPVIIPLPAFRAPEELARQVQREPGCVWLSGALGRNSGGRHSFLAARPFLVLRSAGARLEWQAGARRFLQFGNPWSVLAQWLARFEVRAEIDEPSPLGGCFGFWGYDLKDFLEPKLARCAPRDLPFPEMWAGFYDSLIAFDHLLQKSWIISTGLQPDGSRRPARAARMADFWKQIYEADALPPASNSDDAAPRIAAAAAVRDNFPRTQYIAAVNRALGYIRRGDIYQVNLARRLTVASRSGAWNFFEKLSRISPAPYAAYLNGGDFQIVSSSPELFLRLSGPHVFTRPIKGTRPRSSDPSRDRELRRELQSSAKENAELLMITDLLRNDLGKVCQFGSVRAPELARLEAYAQVQHLVSTVEGWLRPNCAHGEALAAAFPGGSVTGAPKFRAMQIIEELEPAARGPYTGCLGYLGFNNESQLSILIRTAFFENGRIHFPVGAGIVADSDPEAEHQETLAKAAGFFEALEQVDPPPALDARCPASASAGLPSFPADIPS